MSDPATIAQMGIILAASDVKLDDDMAAINVLFDARFTAAEVEDNLDHAIERAKEIRKTRTER